MCSSFRDVPTHCFPPLAHVTRARQYRVDRNFENNPNYEKREFDGCRRTDPQEFMNRSDIDAESCPSSRMR